MFQPYQIESPAVADMQGGKSALAYLCPLILFAAVGVATPLRSPQTAVVGVRAAGQSSVGNHQQPAESK